MPVTIGEFTTEVVAEAERQPPETSGASSQPSGDGDAAMIHKGLAAVARRASRTRAEGFDD